MRAKRAAGIAAVLAVGGWACAEAPTASVQDFTVRSVAGPVVEAVTGSGHFSLPADGTWRTFSFAALRGADGSVDGNFHLRTHVPDGGAKVSGRIVCFTIVGNEAWLAGVIEKAVGPAAGTTVGWRVVDNGEGSAVPPDRIARQRRSVDTAAYCADMPTDQELNDVEAGTIVIHR
jgi:hypothetical protein